MSSLNFAAGGFFCGTVRHSRNVPRRHQFQYNLFMVFVDLAHLDQFAPHSRWGWSQSWPSIAWFRRADHLGDAHRPLVDCVKELVRSETGKLIDGPIRLLTNFRYWGFEMNPISLYYCFDRTDRLTAVVAEVTNTPWGEQHCYVLNIESTAPTRDQPINVDKDLHVSPFFSMNYQYQFSLNSPGETLVVGIQMQDVSQVCPTPVFLADLCLRWKPDSKWTRFCLLVQFPWMTAKVFAAIYREAARLWWKGVPYVPHPARQTVGPAQ